MNESVLLKYSELKELIHIIRYEVQQAQRPANEIILFDEDVQKMLGVSKRTLQYWKSERLIPNQRFDPKSPRTYYLLSDILDQLRKNRVEAIENARRV